MMMLTSHFQTQSLKIFRIRSVNILMKLHFTKLAADTLPLCEKKSSAAHPPPCFNEEESYGDEAVRLEVCSRVAGKQISGGDSLDML